MERMPPSVPEFLFRSPLTPARGKGIFRETPPPIGMATDSDSMADKAPWDQRAVATTPRGKTWVRLAAPSGPLGPAGLPVAAGRKPV